MGRIGPFALATEWVDAAALKDHRGTDLDDGLFDRLGTILDALHERGVARAHPQHPDVLLGPDGSLFLVDLATDTFFDF